MHNYLLISLGHGASAIFTNDHLTIGYEQERIDGIKSSSQFPHDAICEIIKNVGIQNMQNCITFVSHWFNTFYKDKNYESKYITNNNYELLKSFSSKIVFVDENFTHHDAHAYSSLAFFIEHFSNENYAEFKDSKMHLIVADGFGNDREVVSVYEANMVDVIHNNVRLIRRTHGFKSSYGLLYQYATSYCGMKENQDEYKFLGYEAHITKVLSHENITILDSLIANYYEKMQDSSDSYRLNSDDLYDSDELADAKNMWYSHFNNVISNFDIPDTTTNSSHDTRCIIAYFIQGIIELAMKNLIKMHDMKNVVVSGGLFYNVKLNNVILKNIPGIFCAMPLAGDQGAAIGMLYKFTADNNLYNPFRFNGLCLGKRNFHGIEVKLKSYELAKVCTRSKAIVNAIAKLLAHGKIVNLVTGNMEFGPRALCNTSTLFLPTADLVKQNNTNNGRNDIMPCAPVITRDFADKLFIAEELTRVVGSDRYMICTHRYTFTKNARFAGAMHSEPLTEHGITHYTGRPQIIDEGHIVYDILKALESFGLESILVNTSFNAHGKPIAFNTNSIVENYEYQLAHCSENKPYLFVIKDNE